LFRSVSSAPDVKKLRTDESYGRSTLEISASTKTTIGTNDEINHLISVLKARDGKATECLERAHAGAGIRGHRVETLA
jgi:hypothetical protein